MYGSALVTSLCDSFQREQPRVRPRGGIVKSTRLETMTDVDEASYQSAFSTEAQGRKVWSTV